MISAWELYFILQMDSIGNGIGLLSAFAAVAAVACVIGGGMMRDDGDNYEAGRDYSLWVRGCKLQKTGFKWFAFAGVLLFSSCLIPSTRTLAAMVVVPAIVNNTAVQKEAGELYQLAKQALANAVSDDDAPVKKAPAETDSN